MTSREVVNNLNIVRGGGGSNCIGFLFRRIYAPHQKYRIGCRYNHPTSKETCSYGCGFEQSKERVARGITKESY